ncbi:MAG: hypothetical protein K1000chlam3_00453 [Chlamydiae bacterium]|nr:hypothetical protein [Chlamydiota bacterium]
MAVNLISNQNYQKENLFLSWKQRPKEIQSTITRVFEKLATDTFSNWGLFNGTDEYLTCGIFEQNLLKKMILRAPDQQDFYVLDIGAGNFQWGDSLLNFFQEEKEIPSDVTVHVISMRGESHRGQVETKYGRHKGYNFGSFKIEELEAELENRGLFLGKCVDLIVSKWCFRHLVDPTGTFAQAYNLLRPKSGLILMDGFFYLYEKGHSSNDESSYERTFDFLLDARVPFLISNYGRICRSLPQFVLKRADEKPLQLEMEYAGMVSCNNKQVGSYRICKFKGASQSRGQWQIKLPCPVTDLTESYAYWGNKDLFKFLENNKVLVGSSNTWFPIEQKKIEKTT